jgi:hypothetical protein
MKELKADVIRSSVQNVPYSRLSPVNLKTKLYRTIILLVYER